MRQKNHRNEKYPTMNYELETIRRGLILVAEAESPKLLCLNSNQRIRKVLT